MKPAMSASIEATVQGTNTDVTDALIARLPVEDRPAAAKVLRWLALGVPSWSRPEFYEYELDVSAALEELADEIEDRKELLR